MAILDDNNEYNNEKLYEFNIHSSNNDMPIINWENNDKLYTI